MSRENLVQGEIIELMRHAFHDYCGAKACYLCRCLNPMFVLGAQSIEKKLKSLILTLKPNYGKNKLKKIKHNLIPLKEEIKKLTQDAVNKDIGKYWKSYCNTWLKHKYKISDKGISYVLEPTEAEKLCILLDENEDFLTKLTHSYDYFRYPSNYYKNQEQWSSSEIRRLDFFWCQLTDLFPLPLLLKPELPLIVAVTITQQDYCVKIIQKNNDLISHYINSWNEAKKDRERFKK